MIDYEKLQIALDMHSKIKDEYYLNVLIDSRIEYYLCSINYDKDNLYYSSLDELIEKLQELTKPEPKYKVGQEVWIRDNDDILNVKIISISNSNERYYMKQFMGNFEITYSRIEQEMFPSKEALIEAQIEYWEARLEYWTNLLSEELEQHVSGYCQPICRNSEEKSTQHEDMSTPSTCTHDGHINCSKCNTQWTTGFAVVDKGLWDSMNKDHSADVLEKVECQHQHTFLSGFRCIKCGELSPLEFAATEQRSYVNTPVNGIGSWTVGCAHESDGHVRLSFPAQYRCIKCGELYK